jgi:hypothetical protein
MTDFYFNPSTQTTTGLTQAKADTLYLIKGSGTDNLNSNVNINGGLNINSNLVANSLSITAVELSYLDGLNSNIQTQINNIGGGGTSNIGTITTNNQPITNNDTLNVFASKTNTQLTNLSTINTNNGITSSTNIIGSIDFLQSQINNLPNGSGSGQSYFLTNTTSTIDNQFKTISTIPANGTNEILTSGIITSSSPNALMGQFISVSPLNITSIPAGIYDFNFYASLTNNNLSSYLIVEFYKLSSSLTQTLLFTMNGGDINSSIIIPYNINSTQPAFNINLTDYIMIKIYGKTTSTQNITINIDYNSSNNYSHFHIPFILKSNHNDLLNIQGGATNDYQHLTTQQLNNINNPASTTQNGYLTSTNWNTFNNKEPAINKLTAFNRDFETLATNIKINGVQSVGASNNIARSDHIHPSDTTKENTITAGTVNQYWRGDKNWSDFQTSGSSTTGVLTNTDWTTFNNKQNNIVATTTADYYRGDKTFQTLNKAAVGLSNVVNKDFTQPLNGLIYVNARGGSDTNDGLSLINAYASITQALTNTYINSGFQVVIYAGTYNENITISQNNLSIVSSNLEIGGLCNINGNITITSNSTSIRLCGLNYNNLILSGSANLYIQNCFNNGTFLKSGGGYLSMNNIIFGNASTFSITGSGNVNILNGCQVPNITINNTTALINISNNLYITKLIINAGIVSVSNTVIYGSSQSGNQFNCCTVNGNSFLYLNNCDLVNAFNNTPYIISVASTAFYSLNNNTINYAGSSLLGTNLNRQLYFDDLFTAGSQVVNLNSVQTLTNKTLNNPNITNISFSSPKILDNQLLTSTNNIITIPNTTDTIVNLNSNQTLSNKTIATFTMSDDQFRNSLGRTIQIPVSSSADTMVLANYNQTLTNKTISLLDGSTGITQSTSDNTTKLATTAYVKNLLATPNSYVGTSNATSASIQLTTSFQDICSVNIPVNGTYELTYTAIASIDLTRIVSVQLYNSATASYNTNSLTSSQIVPITARLYNPLSKSVIIENLTAGTVITLRAKTTDNTSFILNDATYGYTFLSYKMLGLTTNAISPISWVSISSSNNTTISISGSTATQYQKIYSLGTTQPILPNTSYLDYSYLINGKTLKINYSLLYSNRTGYGDGDKMYIWPLPDGCIIDTTKIAVYTGFTDSTVFSTSSNFFEAFEKSNSLGSFWCNQSTTYKTFGDVLGFYKVGHPYHLKGVYFSINDGITRNIVNSAWYPLSGSLNVSYKFSAEIPIL